MKRNITITVLILVFIVVGILSNISLNNSENTQYIYFMDIENSTVSKVDNNKYRTDDIYWTNDSRYFMFKSFKPDTGFFRTLYDDERLIFSVPDLQCIKVTEDDSFDLSSYIDPNLFVRFREKVWDVYDITEEAREKIKNYIETNYQEALINYSEDKVIFRTPDFKAYFMDLRTGKTKLFAKGFNLKWSKNETKVIYYVHKYRKFEELNGNESPVGKDYITYMYDFNTGKSTKVADFGAEVYFSDDETYLVFREGSIDIPGFPHEV